MIRGTFCDLAIKLDSALAVLIEVKAIGLDLKEHYVKQAVDYAANQGCDWVVLTNGIVWKVYKIAFSKPIERELVVQFDLLAVNLRSSDHIDLVGLLPKEGWQKAHLGEYQAQRRALSRFTLGALVLSDPVLEVLRREVRRLSPEVRVECDEVRSVLESEGLKARGLRVKRWVCRKQVARAAAGCFELRNRRHLVKLPRRQRTFPVKGPTVIHMHAVGHVRSMAIPVFLAGKPRTCALSLGFSSHAYDRGFEGRQISDNRGGASTSR